MINNSAVFLRWLKYEDNFGSVLNVTADIELIQGQYYPTVAFSGVISDINGAYAGVVGHPDSSALNIMKKMEALSFNVLGDGNKYRVMIQTKESRLDGEYNHYGITFDTEKNQASVITVNINDFTQQEGWGKQVLLNKKNAEVLQFAPYTPGEFDIKIWNIMFHRQ